MEKRQAKAQNTEEAILAAAEEEFLRKGFDGARTTSIAEAAGVTHAMLHYYFRTKEQLFGQILEQKMQLMGELLLAAFGNPGQPLLQRIADGIECHFDFLAANASLPRFIINEVISRPECFETFQKRISQIVASLLKGLQHDLDLSAARGETEPMDVRTLMLDIVSLNVFPFIAEPIIMPLMKDLSADRSRFLSERKAENREIILRRLTKKHTQI